MSNELADHAIYERLEEIRRDGGWAGVRVALDTGQRHQGKIEKLSSVTVTLRGPGSPTTIRISAIDTIEPLA